MFKMKLEVKTVGLKYCIITDGGHPAVERENMEAVGFYQWLNAFEGRIFQAKDILPSLRDGDFDIIHVRLTPANLPVIHSIRSRIGEKSGTRLVLSMDIPVRYWKKHSLDMGGLRDAVHKADFVFATEHTICRALEKSTGKPVYELPYPADIQKLKAYPRQDNGQIRERGRVLNVLGQREIKGLLWAKWYAERCGIQLRVIIYQEPDEKWMKKLQRNKIETVLCKDEASFCKALAGGEALVAPYDCSDYGKWVIYAAAQGITVIGNTLLDSSRRCYPLVYARVRSLRFCAMVFRLGLGNRGMVEYLRENAWHKVEYYNWYNMKNRFLALLSRETGDRRFEGAADFPQVPKVPVFLRDITHLYGETAFSNRKDELAVVCLVKNGMEHMEVFLDHYKALGANRFVFIDNGSTDGTVEFLINRDNVTVYQTSLSHKHFENEIRRTVIENLFSDSWCLCVDIDELFDYPCSGKVSLAQFLGYLNQYGYTAVIAYMLDMFPREPDDAGIRAKRLTESYCYYDISHIQKEGYFDHNPNFCNYNRLSDRRMPCYYGGIRRKYFGKETSKYMLIKHPLIFVDRKIEPVTDPHFCNKAYVADINCLLKHYKFTDAFKERLDHSAESYGFFGKTEHQEYSRVLKASGSFRFYSPTARKLENIDDLIVSGFLRVSKKYMEFVERQGGTPSWKQSR